MKSAVASSQRPAATASAPSSASTSASSSATRRCDEVAGDRPPVVELDAVAQPLPDLAAGDLGGGGVLHQVVDADRAEPAQPRLEVADADADVGAHARPRSPRRACRPTASRSAAVVVTSSRCRSSWCGRSPRTPSNTSRQASTMPGWATQEPSKPSPASRVLSSASLAKACSLTRGVLARDERRHAADRVRPAAVAGAHQQLGVGAHERHGHGHRGRGRAARSRGPARGST